MTDTQLYMITPQEKVEIHFVTSDEHFGHANIIKYTNRPFNDVDHMNAELIARHNSLVKPEHTSLSLGDFALGKITDTILNASKLHGRKGLLVGNHDNISQLKSKKFQLKYADLYEAHFDWILPESGIELEAWKKGKKRSLFASHYPAVNDYPEGIKDKFKHLRPKGSTPIIHGHTHSHHVFLDDTNTHFHVGVDAHNYYPVPAELIVDWVFSLPVSDE